MTETEGLLVAIKKRFKTYQVKVEFFGPDSWGVWVPGWHIHVHPRNFYGTLAAQAKTLEEAAKTIIILADHYTASPGDVCKEGKCPHYQKPGQRPKPN